MESIKSFMLENGYGGFIREMSNHHYINIISKINKAYNKNYDINSYIPENEIIGMF